jgi:hypothetical protein
MLIKSLVSILIFISLNSYLSAQDKIYTKGLPNGFAWTAPFLSNKPVYAKEESLLANLQQRNRLADIDSSINKRSFPLDCDDYINKLQNENITIEFEKITKSIDDFYKVEENLIIPVLGAYCYSVKELTGVHREELENYRQELLKYSKDKLSN